MVPYTAIPLYNFKMKKGFVCQFDNISSIYEHKLLLNTNFLERLRNVLKNVLMLNITYNREKYINNR